MNIGKKFGFKRHGLTVALAALLSATPGFTNIAQAQAVNLNILGGGGGGAANTGANPGGGGGGAIVSDTITDNAKGGRGGQSGGLGGHNGTSNGYFGYDGDIPDIGGWGSLIKSEGPGINSDSSGSTSTSQGGFGGNARYIGIGSNINLGTVNITAGDGGQGATIGAGVGGKGGDAILDATGKKVTLTGTTIMQSGVAGTNNTGTGGAGGNAKFIAGTVKGGGGSLMTTLQIAGNYGSKIISIGDVEAIDGNLSLDFSGMQTANGDRADITGNMTVGGGKTLSINDLQNILNWSGNTLVVKAHNGIDLTSIVQNSALTMVAGNLDLSNKSIKFEIPEASVANGASLLTTSTAITVNNTTNVSISMVGGGTGSLVAGDTITLISNITNGGSGIQKKVTAQGASYLYNFDVDGTGASLTATFVNSGVSGGGSHNQLMGTAAAATLATSGADAIVEAIAQGSFIPRVVAQSKAPLEIGSFLYMGGGHYKVDTGSHVKSDNLHLMAGPGIRFRTDKGGRTTLGAFFEAGWGNYDTYNSFGGDTYLGSGNTSYTGAGILGKHEMSNGVYVDGSFRMGTLKTKYQTDWVDADYHTHTLYYGGYLGGGYEMPVTEKGKVDLSLRLFWTHVDSDKFRTSVGDIFDIDSTDSIRHQLGVTYKHAFKSNITGYIGGAWEYEYDGETKGTMDGNRVSPSKTQGNSGIGRIGIEYSPEQDITFGFFGHGVIGRREGAGGSLNVSIAF